LFLTRTAQFFLEDPYRRLTILELVFQLEQFLLGLSLIKTLGLFPEDPFLLGLSLIKTLCLFLEDSCGMLTVLELVFQLEQFLLGLFLIKTVDLFPEDPFLLGLSLIKTLCLFLEDSCGMLTVLELVFQEFLSTKR
jgi:hypothetical protein